MTSNHPRKRPDLPFGRRQIFPSEVAQERFALEPCAVCDEHGLPHLVNIQCELYWEHHHPGTGRTQCIRYGHLDRIKDGSLPPEPMFFGPDDLTRAATHEPMDRKEFDRLFNVSFQQRWLKGITSLSCLCTGPHTQKIRKVFGQHVSAPRRIEGQL